MSATPRDSSAPLHFARNDTHLLPRHRVQDHLAGDLVGGDEAEGVGGVREREDAVGQDALDRDALALEVGKRPDKEGSSGHAAFVWQGLGVGITGVVVHGHMDEVKPEARTALRPFSLTDPSRAASRTSLSGRGAQAVALDTVEFPVRL